VFDPRATQDAKTTQVLQAAIRRSPGSVRGGDVIHAVLGSCLESHVPAIRDAFETTLGSGIGLNDLREGIDAYTRTGDGDGFSGSPHSFTSELLAALSSFAAEFEPRARRLRPVALELLTACVLEHPDELDRRFLGALHLGDVAARLRRRVRLQVEAPPSLFEGAGLLRSEEFTADAWAVLERSTAVAADLGHGSLLIPHCFLALLAETEGLAERALRRQLPARIGVPRAAEIIADVLRVGGSGGVSAPRLHRDELGISLQQRLQRARDDGMAQGAERIDVPHLLAALFAAPSEQLAAALRVEPLNVDFDLLAEQVRETLRDAGTAGSREVPYQLPSSLPPSEDLTWLARTDAIAPARGLDHHFDGLLRALHRMTERHVLITGLPGTGRTTLLRELARRAASGEIPFMARKRFIRVDGRDVDPAHSEARLAELISHVGGRSDVVLCLDDLGPLLRGPNGTRHNLLFRSALKQGRIHVVGVLGEHDYHDLVAGDQELLDISTRIELAEPDRSAAREMVRAAADALERRFGFEISDQAVARAVVLAADFLPRTRLPHSAVRVLDRACEDLRYRRDVQREPSAPIGPDAVIRTVSELSGLPSSQLGGADRESLDYVRLLGTRVVGQTEAVRLVARELRHIKSGLAGVRPGPAAVLLFAGMTGVGKTELAKAMAELYSASKHLQTYPMGSNTEAHSVSSFLGSPPGYIGSERGGRLINELNADPYGVFLLDEADKAHPEVLRPFLNLFDEGWITDQQGVRAYADRAIFILTSNAGQEVIAEMTARGASAAEIDRAVRERMHALRSRDGQQVFTPELLARIDRIIVFRPIDLKAMIEICQIRLERRQELWRTKFEKELVVSKDLMLLVSTQGHERNQQAGGKEGGRIIEKLLAQFVDDPLHHARDTHAARFDDCVRLEVGVRQGSGGAGISSTVRLLGSLADRGDR
jgi:ATP-dependent Clp protease ATP-binding subunit ClpA